MSDQIELLVIGASAGGLNAPGYIFEHFGEKYPVPILVTRHLGRQDEEGMLKALKQNRRAVLIML